MTSGRRQDEAGPRLVEAAMARPRLVVWLVVALAAVSFAARRSRSVALRGVAGVDR